MLPAYPGLTPDASNSTFMPSTILSSPELGSRPAGYKPDITDYIWYERARDEFLRGPRGRVALMQGGIAWRLARETLEDVGTHPFQFKIERSEKDLMAINFTTTPFRRPKNFLYLGACQSRSGETTADTMGARKMHLVVENEFYQIQITTFHSGVSRDII